MAKTYGHSVRYGEITVKGKSFGVNVNADGMFWAEIDEAEALSRPSLQELREALQKYVGRKKLNIPFVEITGAWNRLGELLLETGLVTGIHMNGNLIVKYEGRKYVEQHARHSNALLKDDVDRGELLRLHEANVKATADWEEFIKKNRLVLPEEE